MPPAPRRLPRAAAGVTGCQPTATAWSTSGNCTVVDSTASFGAGGLAVLCVLMGVVVAVFVPALGVALACATAGFQSRLTPFCKQWFHSGDKSPRGDRKSTRLNSSH